MDILESLFMKKGKIQKEHQPWNLSYRMSMEARPSWARHGLPALFDEFIKLVKKSNHKNGKHLDIGCGNGVKTVNYALAGFTTVGIDISDEGFREAREIIKELRVSKKCKVVKANVLNLPFEDDSMRSVSDTLCFTHLKSSDQPKYKSELKRVLKDGAFILMVLFSDKDEHFHGHKVSKKYTFHFDPTNPLMEGYTHYHGMYNYHFDKKEIIKTFKDDFEIVKMEEVKHPIYPHRFLWNVIMRKKVTNGKVESN